jgi:hypothetical protein
MKKKVIQNTENTEKDIENTTKNPPEKASNKKRKYNGTSAGKLISQAKKIKTIEETKQEIKEEIKQEEISQTGDESYEN